jgi:SOS-response transcriptional repressor LexA
MQSVGETIRLARIHHEETQESLAAKTKMSANAIGEMERGNSQPRAASLLSIARALGYNTWEQVLAKFASARPFSAQLGPEGLIPLFEEVPAGNGDFDPTHLGEDNGYSAEMISRSVFPGLTHPLAYAVTVKGDSMEPDFIEGETVACVPIRFDELEPGMYVVFRLADGQTGIKLIEPDEDKEYAWLVPLNKRYRRQRVRLDEFVNLSRAVFKTVALP